MDSKVDRLLSQARSCGTKFKQGSESRYVEKAINLDREALGICSTSHFKLPVCLSQLSTHLWYRYNKLGGIENINEAIFLNRQALALRPPEHPDRTMSLNSLAICLWTRYKQLGGVDDLDEAIVLDQEALSLCPPGHPLRSRSLKNLAIRLWTRYSQLHRLEDLNDAIVLDKEALALRPLGHPDRPSCLNNLAIRLCTRFNQSGGMEDLDEAIFLNQEALSLRPPGHRHRPLSLHSLAICLWTRHHLLRRVEDLNEAIDLARNALVLRPQGHPLRSTSLKNLASYLTTRYRQLGVEEDREEIFRLYSGLVHGPQTVSLDDLSAAKEWIKAAEHFHHPTTLLAYETALRLLVHHISALPSLPQHLSVLKKLTSSLAVDAFSACLRNKSPMNAVEVLEQGRGVFWSQLTRLRSPLDDVIASGPAGKTLASEFTRLTSLIRYALTSPGSDQYDQVCNLNFELQGVVSNIRKLPGLSRFLLPLLFSNLRHAACVGPVIIVNASQHSCDALVVSVDRDPVHIPLSVTTADVRELSSKLHTLTLRAKRSDVTRDLSIVLRELWDHVVSLIVDFLRTTYPPRSRIWWCPTAEFSLLPLHAAAPYRKGQQSLADLYISSYTPTLSALVRARQNHHSNPSMEQKHFLGIGQAIVSGADELLSVGTELANIGQCVDRLAIFTRLGNEESRISRVTQELSKSQWAHFACHGIPNKKQSFESAFGLYDGHLTIQRIIQCDLQNPEFAYLSACHTTVGDEESLDEVIHLASAIQFAGFRSVIGTMWAVDDAETNKITTTFYKHIVDESGRLDHTRAAYALWKTMRSVKVPLDQRILYIHLGA